MYWIAHLEGGPQRVNHAATVVDNKIYTFGGYSSDETFEYHQKIDIHVFDTDSLRWRPVVYKNNNEAAKKLYGHTVVTYGHKILLWGGRNNHSASNILYCYDTESLLWNIPPVSGSVPSKVDGHSACIIGSYMYIYGGYEGETELFTNEVHRLNLNTLVWEHIITQGRPPPSRDFHTASVIGNRMYIFGGRSYSDDVRNEEYHNEIMYLDTSTMTWVIPVCSGKPPSGRRSHSAVVYNNEIYIIGGFEGETKYHLNDIHKFDPATGIWCEMHVRGEPPCPRRRHCTCVVGDHLFLFGGSSPYNAEEYARQYLHEHHVNSGLQLHDHSDINILDFFPSLKRLCQLKVIQYMSYLDILVLPTTLAKEIKILASETILAKSFNCNYPREDFPAYACSA